MGLHYIGRFEAEAWNPKPYTLNPEVQGLGFRV